MPEIKHNFTGGKMNKDLDERIVKNGEYRDAMNIQVSTSEDSEVGTVQNLLGNSIVSGQDFVPSAATCIGSISNESEDKLYYFITNVDLLRNPNFSRDLNDNGFADYWAADSGGWSWDAENKRHVGNNVSLFNKIRQSNGLKENLPLGTPVNLRFTLSGIDENDPGTIGKLSVEYYNSSGEGIRFDDNNFSPSNRSYEFTGVIGDDTTSTTSLQDLFFIQRIGNTGFTGNVENVSLTYGKDMIIEYDKKLNKITPVFVDTTKQVLKFHYQNLITGINIIDDMLFFTDNNNEPKKINIPRSIKGTDPSGTVHTNFLNEFTNIEVPAKEEHITVIKKQPVIQPSIEFETELDFTKTNSALTKILFEQSLIPNSDGIVGSEYNFSSFQVGAIRTIRLFTDLDGESGFTLGWQVGDILGIKAFDGINYDQQPSVPLSEYNIRAKIIDSSVNDFTDEALEIVPNFSFLTPNSNNTAPLYWGYLNPNHFTYNHIQNKIEVDAGDWQKWTSSSLPVVGGGKYKLSMQVSNFVSGGVNIWLCVKHDVIGGTPGRSYYFRLNSSPTGTSQYITGDGYYEKEFDLILGQETSSNTSSGNSSFWNAGQSNQILLQTTGITGPGVADNIYDIEYISLERLDQTNAQVKIEVLAVPDPPPVVPSTLSEINFVVSKLTKEKKIFEFKFPRIAYRYKYQDNEYSAISPFSQVCFAPGSFDYHPKKGYNLGMANQLTGIIIKNLKASIPDGVKEIDIIYKEDTSPNLYVVDTIKPNTPSVATKYSNINFWNDGQYVITTEQIYRAISSNQLVRPWDNVPKKALGQEVVASRVVYANYTQGYDLISNTQNYFPDFNFDFISKDVNSITLPSVKTLREYQIGAVFVDEYGRETPVISSIKGSSILDKEFADKSNSIKVSFDNSNYPENLKYVKFFIKETSGEYYNMAMDRWYDAGDNQVWLSFPSSDVNKIDINDFLILKKGVESDNLIKDEAKFKILDIQREAPDYIKQNKILIESLTHNTDANAGTVVNIFDSADDLPILGKKQFKMNYEEFTKSLSRDLHNEEDGVLYIEFVDLNSNQASDRYRINKIQSTFGQSGVTLADAQYIVMLDKLIGDDINWATNDSGGINSTAINDGITVQVYRYEVENSAEFDGKFFVKIDTDGNVNSELLSSSLGASQNYRLKMSKRLYSLDTNISSNNRSELTGQGLGQYKTSDFGAFAPFFRNYWSKPTRFSMSEDTGGANPTTVYTGQYAFAEDQIENNYQTYHQQTWILDNVWRDELAYITVGLDTTSDSSYTGNGFSGYPMISSNGLGNDAKQKNARLADSHGWTKRNRENNTVWFIDKGPWKGKTKDNSNTLRFGGQFIQYDANGVGSGAGVENDYIVFDIAAGGILRNSEYFDEVSGAGNGEKRVQSVNTINVSAKTQDNFWNIGANGGNNNYNTTKNLDLINYFTPGTKIRFSQDPTNQVYTISAVPETSGKIRYNAGFTGGLHWSGQSSLAGASGSSYYDPNYVSPNQPTDWLWADVIQPNDSFDIPVPFVFNFSSQGGVDTMDAWNISGASSNYEPLDEPSSLAGFDITGIQSGSGSNWQPNTSKRTSQLSPNFSKNWKLKCLNSGNTNVISWNPAGNLGPIPGGLELTIAHSSFSSSSDPGAPKANYSASGSECYIMVDSLFASNYDGSTKKITVGLILTAHSGTDALDNTGSNFSKQELLIWKIEEISGKFRIWLCGYRKPLCLSGTAGNASSVSFNTHDIVGNLPSSAGTLTFKQPAMNGYSQYSCNRINAQDSLQHGYEVYDNDMGIDNGVPGIMPVYYNLEILEPIQREATLPDNPAIWETEPKETVDLDIYYEASGYNPLYVDESTKNLVAPIGSILSASTSSVAIEENTKVTGINQDSSGWYITVNPSVFVGTGYIETGGFITLDRPDGSSITLQVTNYTNVVNSKSSFIYFNTDIYGPSTSYTLNWHNCFSFGNGVESNRVRDNFNLPFIAKGVKASTTLENFSYEEENRKYGLIYSGLYNSNSGVNELNQFIAAEKITKDINPTYGSIQKLYARDTDLIALCEDKVLQILASKDAVFNADGNPQLVSTNRVLGQSRPFVGEFGISKNPESFAAESYRVYFSDKVRGAIVRLSRDGLTPISDAGMKDWFKDNLKLSTKVVGSYDDKKDEYNVTIYKENDNTNNIQEEEAFVGTLSFKESVKGWVSFKSFALENGVSCANDYYTLKKGRLWQHHSEEVDRNTFYDNFESSSVNVLLNDIPASIKSFHALSYEGSQAKIAGYQTDVATGITDYSYHNIIDKNGWFVNNIKTDQGQGSLNEFVQKERKWFNYIKGIKNIDGGDLIPEFTDYSAFNIQGIGVVTNVEEDFIDFDVQLNASVDIGDVVYYSQLQIQGVAFGGTVTNILDVDNLDVAGIVSFANGDTIQLNINTGTGGTIPSIGDYCFFVKNQIVNMANLLGYYAEAKFVNNSTDKAELFMVSAEITESSK